MGKKTADQNVSTNENGLNSQNNQAPQNNLALQMKVSGIKKHSVSALWAGRIMPTILRGSTAHNKKVREQQAKTLDNKFFPSASAATSIGPSILSTEQLIAKAQRYLAKRSAQLKETSILPSLPTQEGTPLLTCYETYLESPQKEAPEADLELTEESRRTCQL